MKKLIFTVLVCLLVYIAWQKFDVPRLFDRVEMTNTKLEEKTQEANETVAAYNDAQQQIFQVLSLMNEVTVNTMKLQQMGEGQQTATPKARRSMREQLDSKMKQLRELLAEARQLAGEHAELLDDVQRLQQSFEKREATIRGLQAERADLDEELRQAVNDLEKENDALETENVRLNTANAQLRSTVNSRKQAQYDAWIFAGDELVRAARTIPRANSALFSGSQSQEVTRSKQMILRNATECYNAATRMCNASGDMDGARSSRAKAVQADRLFSLVTNNESIGEAD